MMLSALYPYHRPGPSNGQSCYTVLSTKAFFWVAYQASLLIFFSLFQRSVSDPFPYFSCHPCLPLRLPFSYCPKHFLTWGFPLQQH